MRNSRALVRRPAIVPTLNAAPTPSPYTERWQRFIAPHMSIKSRGGWAESAFQNLAIAMGFTVCKPWNDNGPYDFIIERNGRMLRIQVKSAFSACHNQYQFKSRRSKETRTERCYTAAEVDFFACFIAPLDIWYIIPIREISTRQGAIYVRPPEAVRSHVCPQRGSRNYEHFRERWDLLLK